MTSLKSLALIFVLLGFSTLALEAAPPSPPISILEVAQIAQKHLEGIGRQDDVFVATISYKGLFGEPYWSVSWSKMFPSGTDGVKETGLKVKMDGTYLRTVKKK